MVPTFSHTTCLHYEVGTFCHQLGGHIVYRFLVEGDKSGHITLTTFVPPPIPLGIPFLSGKHI